MVFVSTVAIGIATVCATMRTDGPELGEPQPDIEGMPGGGAMETFQAELPSSWHVEVDSGRETGGWRQIGHVQISIEEAVAELNAFMSAHGLEQTRMVDCDNGRGTPGKLIQYESPGGIQVLWMLWCAGGMNTGFSWGRER